MANAFSLSLFAFQALNLGILVGSLSGPILGNALGVQPALLVGAGLRFLAGVLLLLV